MRIKYLEKISLSFPRLSKTKIVSLLMIAVWLFLAAYLVSNIKESVDEKEEESAEEVEPTQTEKIIDQTLLKIDKRFYLIPKDFTREQAIQLLEKELLEDGK